LEVVLLMRESSTLSALCYSRKRERDRERDELINSYAGWIGTVGAAHKGVPHPTLEDAATRLAAIAGTSTCHIAQSKEGILVPGVVRLLSPTLYHLYPTPFCRSFTSLRSKYPSISRLSPLAPLEARADNQWGPYRDAVFPGLWMNEGGQSSTGQLIDFVMSTHPAYPKLLAEAEKTGKNPFTLLGERLDRMRIEKGLETASTSLFLFCQWKSGVDE
jgi:ribulose kinase